jgi:hypothetical protein
MEVVSVVTSQIYALVADIEKAFHMISIKQEDRNALRFLWFKCKEDRLSEIMVYRFCRLVFGLKPSPAILGATIKHHLLQQSISKPKITKILEDDLYVDDLATETEDEAIRLYNSAKEIMSRGGFNLRKWKSNSSRVRQYIQNCQNCDDGRNKNEMAAEGISKESVTEDDESYAKVSVNPLNSNEACEMKVLGNSWNFEDDTLKYSIQDLVVFARLLPVTKRSVLRMSARIFDPLGIITPFSISLKILFQELCLGSAKWDAQLRNPFRDKWEKLILQLPALKDISVARNCFPVGKNKQLIELHGFSDASAKAYAATIDVRVVNDDIVHTSLMCAKTCVAPVKTQTIPRSWEQFSWHV